MVPASVFLAATVLALLKATIFAFLAAAVFLLADALTAVPSVFIAAAMPRAALLGGICIESQRLPLCSSHNRPQFDYTTTALARDFD